MLGFGRRADPAEAERRAARERVKAWAREALDLPEDAAVTVSEIVCADPACPGEETVVLVMRRGQRTRAYKAAGEAASLTREALLAALGLAPGGGPAAEGEVAPAGKAAPSGTAAPGAGSPPAAPPAREEAP